MNGAVLFARRPRHDGDTGAENIVVGEFQAGMTTTKDFREQVGQAGVHLVEGFFKAVACLTVDFLNGAFQCGQGFFQIFVLGIQIDFTL